VFGKFGLLELCRLNLFKFCIKVLKIKRKLNSPPPSWAIDPYNNIICLLIERGGDLAAVRKVMRRCSDEGGVAPMAHRAALRERR
jgi:hypothetical protein